MKKYILLVVVVGLLLVVACPGYGSIFANPQAGQTVYFTGGAGNGGGPFVGHLSNGVTWDTFCVEADGAVEWFVPGATYNVLSTQLSTATASGNTVTAAAKWLYWMYGTDQSAITGIWNGHTYAYDDNSYDDKTSLQEAIWRGVNRLYGGNLTAPPDAEPMSDAAKAWYQTAYDAVNVAKPPEFLNYVYVVNPGPKPDGYPGHYYKDGVEYFTSESQSMLYAIPEPASIIVWFLITTVSCLGVTAWRRQARG
jgi:hypothetical protein